MENAKLEIRHPWKMPFDDIVEIFIEALHQQIGPKHPLYRREVYPTAIRREPDAAIYETDDEPYIYAIVYLSLRNNFGKRKRGDRNDPRTEILPDRAAIQARMDHDAEEWARPFK